MRIVYGDFSVSGGYNRCLRAYLFHLCYVEHKFPAKEFDNLYERLKR